MFSYRIWGLVAGLVGAFLTYFFIDLLGINISTDDARLFAFFVGLGIYLIPLYLPKLLKKFNSPIQFLHQTNISLKKMNWLIIMKSVESDCQSKGQEWIQWGDKIIGHIKVKTDAAISPDEKITISFYEDNLEALKKIIDRQGWKS